MTIGTLGDIAHRAAARGVRSPAVIVAGDVVTMSPYADGAFAEAAHRDPATTDLVRNP